MFYTYVHEQAFGIRDFMDQSQSQIDENLISIEVFTQNNEFEQNDYEDLANQL